MNIHWISAAAGTGKTFFITHSICKLILQGVNPDNILCLSFSQAAANEMKNRIYKIMYKIKNKQEDIHLADIIIPKNVDEVVKKFFKSPIHFHTIHSYALKIIRSVNPHITVIEEMETKKLLEQAIAENLKDATFIPVLHELQDHIACLNTYLFDLLNITQTSGLTNNYSCNFPTLPKVKISNALQKALKKNDAKLLKVLQNNDIDVIIKHVLTQQHIVKKNIISSHFVKNHQEEHQELQKLLQIIFEYNRDKLNYIACNKSKILTDNINRILYTFQQSKDKKQLLDFQDIISYATNIIRRQEHLSLLFDTRNIEHIFLDEAQDTHAIQWTFIKALFHHLIQLHYVSLWIVGDVNQTIYNFNGNINKTYQHMYSAFKTLANNFRMEFYEYELTTCYRSTQMIVDYVNEVMANHQTEMNITSAIRHTEGIVEVLPPIEFQEKNSQKWEITEPNIAPWIQECIDVIQKVMQRPLITEMRMPRYDDILILIRKRTHHLLILLQQLNQKNIPIREHPFSLMEEPLIKDILNIIRVIYNPDTDFALASLLKSPYFKWTDNDLLEIAWQKTDSIFKQLDPLIPKHAQVLTTIKRWQSFPKTTHAFFAKLIFSDDFGQKLMSTEFYHTLLAFWEYVQNYPSNSLSQFVLQEQTKYVPFKINISGVKISTIHAAKGQEAPIVICTDAYAYYSPAALVAKTPIIFNGTILLPMNHPKVNSIKHALYLNEKQKKKNMMYVALTRSKEQIYILSCMNDKNNTSFEKFISNAYEVKKVCKISS